MFQQLSITLCKLCANHNFWNQICGNKRWWDWWVTFKCAVKWKEFFAKQKNKLDENVVHSCATIGYLLCPFVINK